MNKIKKIISIILITLVMLSVNSIATFPIEEANLYSKSCYTNLLKWNGITLECNYVVYIKDGVEYPAYCLQRELDGVSTKSNYSVKINELMNNAMVWRTITNGYPYKSCAELGCDNEYQAFMATKQAVYCILYDRDVNEYIAMNENGEKCLTALKKIVETARESKKTKASSEIKIIEENKEWQIEEENNKQIYKKFKVEASSIISNYEILVSGDIPEGIKILDKDNNEKKQYNSGETFKITIPISNLIKDGTFKIEVKGKVATKPIFYGKSPDSTRQDYALTASIYEEGVGIKTENYRENATKIVITKTDEADNKLKGIKFSLLDQNKNEIYTGLETNEEGKIIIEKIIPGMYYLKEISTLEGYKLNEDLIQINLQLNETKNVKVKNIREDIVIESEKIETEMEVKIKLPKTRILNNIKALP